MNEIIYTIRNPQNGKVIDWCGESLAQRLLLQGWICIGKKYPNEAENEARIISETIHITPVEEPAVLTINDDETNNEVEDIVEIVEIIAEHAQESAPKNTSRSNGRSKKK